MLTSGPEVKPVADPHVVNIQVSVGLIVGLYYYYMLHVRVSC